MSAISKVETLGYPELGENEKQFLEEFFDAAEVLSVSKMGYTPGNIGVRKTTLPRKEGHRQRWSFLA